MDHTHQIESVEVSSDSLRSLLRQTLSMFVILSLLCGVAYTGAITGIAQALWPHEANGSRIEDAAGNAVGSELIGQQFNDPAYFWPRLSATAPYPYNGASSSGSNLGPLSPELTGNAQARIDALREADPGNLDPIPVDLVTASGSGLDPHISIAAAEYQAQRVATARGLDIEEVNAMIDDYTSGRVLGILGEPVVNVLELNLALDRLTGAP